MAIRLDPETGEPLRADGTRYGMVEPHPFVLSTSPARFGLCHLCNGTRDWVAHPAEGSAGDATTSAPDRYARILADHAAGHAAFCSLPREHDGFCAR